METVTYDRTRLMDLVRESALQFGDFTLASGKRATYYLDCRKLTLSSAGALQVAAGMLELMKPLPDAVGGMAIGADPITGAVITLAAMRNLTLKGFIVRKEAKTHGTGQQVEGPVVRGDRAVIVEDVVTTGGSSLRAIEHAREFGLEITRVISIVDRLQGGADTFAKAGIEYDALLTIEDFGLSAD